ncbi:cytidylyltransferase family protein [Apiospora phragmitis]|uniref:Cytidylyltransferase family protein n=1 Tax=Apiospora phragmitis TaxID=2905665 RepID=A0ABR1WTX4_9PEZI
MSASDVTNTEIMGSPRQLPANLVSYFTRALKTFQLSETTFTVLCSVSSATPSRNNGTQIAAPIPPKQAPRTLVVLDSSFNPPTLAHQRMALSALADLRKQQHAPRDSRVLLLLAINNADKAPKPAAFPQRLAMMYVFAQDLLSAARTQRRHLQQAAAAPDSGSSSSIDAGTEEEEDVVDIAVTTEPYFHSKSNAVATSEFYGGDAAARKGEETEMEQLYLTGFDTLIRIFDAKYYPNDTMRQALDPLWRNWGTAADQRAYLDGLRDGKLEAMGGRREWADKVAMVEGGREEGGKGSEDIVVISSTKVRSVVQREDWQALQRLVSEGVSEWVRTQGLYKEEA